MTSEYTEIARLDDELSGFWLDLESVSVSEGVLTITMHKPDSTGSDWWREFVSSPKMPAGRRIVVRVFNVVSVSVEDKHRVRFYNVLRCDFDERRGVIAVACGIPLTLEIAVSGLRVTVEDL